MAKTSFRDALKHPVPTETAKKVPLAPPSAVLRSPPVVAGPLRNSGATLTTARTAAHQAATHLQVARVAHHHVAAERVDGRLLDLICKELVIEFTRDPANKAANQDLPLAPPTPGLPVPPAFAVSLVPTTAPRTVDGSVRAAQAVELIEKIEMFIKDARTPSIALTLNNSLGAKVEIERVGPREVALRLIGHRGPPPAEDIGRIRDEMAAHGLKVCALSVG